MQHLEQIHDLSGGVGRARLLAVAKSGIGDEELRRRIKRLDGSVENDARHAMIGKHAAQQVGFGDVLKFARAFELRV